MQLGRLHVIVDVTPQSDRHGVTTLVRAVLRGGAPVVQLRAKGITDSELYELCSAVQDQCATAGADLIVNDRVDVAMAVGAAGVHLGEHDLPVGAAVHIVGDGRLVGGTARDPQRARELQAAGAAYLGVGPVYATTSKAGLPSPIGLATLAAVTRVVEVPVIAIAGITAARVPDVIAAGAHGVAVIGAVSSAPDPSRATAELMEAIATAVGRTAA